MKFLDTNTIVYISKDLIDLSKIIDDDNEYVISVITYMEVLGFKFESTTEEDFVKKFLSYFRIVYIDEQICDQVVNLRKRYNVKLPDAIISATCMVNDATLITNDVRLKSIENLKLDLLGI